MIGLCLGSIGTVLAFLGLECTRVGGGQRSKDGLLVTASAFHLAGCEYEALASADGLKSEVQVQKI